MAKTSNYLFKLDLMILSLLKEKDQYAYELTKEIAEKSKGRIEPKNGTMYPIIYKLIENGYISSNTIIYHNKARVYYHLEPAGKEYLDKIIVEFDELVDCINSFIHKEIGKCLFLDFFITDSERSSFSNDCDCIAFLILFKFFCGSTISKFLFTCFYIEMIYL